MSKTVLIVDDNEPTRKLLAGIIGAAGYTVIEADGGDGALLLAKKQEIDCALIDQHMEPMSGFMLARAFQTKGYTFPMTMITAHEGSDLLLQAQKYGFMSIMMKPVGQNRLLKLIERMCR